MCRRGAQSHMTSALPRRPPLAGPVPLGQCSSADHGMAGCTGGRNEKGHRVEKGDSRHAVCQCQLEPCDHKRHDERSAACGQSSLKLRSGQHDREGARNGSP
jgi:hypothetical protein